MSLRNVSIVLCLASVAWFGLAPAARAQAQHAPQAEAENAGDAHGGGAVHDDAAGHGDGAAAHGGSTNPMVFDPDLAIWTVVIFAILLAVLWKFAWGPIASALDLREKKIADNIALAEQANVEAKRLLGEYEAKLSSAREEVRAIIEEARRDAEHAGQEIVAKARTDAQAEVQRGKHEIETATGQALKELAERSANLAVDLAGKIVQSKLNAADHARLIEDAMTKFPQRDHSRN